MNKICLNLKVRINYILKLFNHPLIQAFIPFLEFPASVRHSRTTAGGDGVLSTIQPYNNTAIPPIHSSVSLSSDNSPSNSVWASTASNPRSSLSQRVKRLV